MEERKTVLQIAGWKSESCDDGPGIRSVLFLQGCHKNCPGCFNQKTHDREGGRSCTVEEAADFVIRNCPNRKLTISGGEPLEQMEGLMALLDLLHADHFDLCLYTGRELPEVPEQVLQKVHYLKTGGFQRELADPRLQYMGSSNQHFFAVEKNGALRELVRRTDGTN